MVSRIASTAGSTAAGISVTSLGSGTAAAGLAAGLGLLAAGVPAGRAGFAAAGLAALAGLAGLGSWAATDPAIRIVNRATVRPAASRPNRALFKQRLRTLMGCLVS